MYYYSTNDTVFTTVKKERNAQIWAEYQKRNNCLRQKQQVHIERRGLRSDRDEIRNFVAKKFPSVYNKYGKRLDTEVVFCDILPKESSLYFQEPKDYHGYRNMEWGGCCEHITLNVAIEQHTYNAGAWGYVHYVETVYIKTGATVLDVIKALSSL